MSSFADDLSQLVGDSALVMIGRIALIGGGFLAHTLLVRNLSPDTFGVLSLALTVVSVCAGFAAVGMNQAIARFIGGSGPEDADEYVVISLSVVLISGGIFTLLLYFFSGTVASYFDSTGLAVFLKTLSILIILRPLSKVIMGVTRGFELTRTKVISHDILPMVMSVPVLYYFITRNQIIAGAVVYYVLQPVIQTLLLTLNLHRWGGWSLNITAPGRDKMDEIFSFSWPLAFESMVVLFLGSIDILMLGWLTTSEVVGQYRSIQPVAKTVIIFLQVLTFIYLPIATRYYEQQDFDQLDSFYKASARWMSHVTFPLVLFYLLFGRDFIQVVFGEEYVVAWVALAILTLGMYSRVVAGPNGMTIKAINRTREDLVASIGALLTNVGLNYILIPFYGIVGAAAATMVGYLVYNTIDLLIIYRYTGVTPFHLDLFKPFIPTTVACLGLTYLFNITAASLVELVLLGVAISGIHLLSIFLTTGLTEEDQMLLNNLKARLG
ncbi:flippase [Haloferax volcanii]|uniref:flippase n=1 Tax=Haloferax volcanii TaxID=2246 RepID=UPI0009FCFE7D|nr:flippase [Haloferax lucentense]